MKVGIVISSMLALAACTTAAPDGEPRERVAGADGRCDAAAAEPLVGQPVTQQVGEQALEMTGARLFRWAPPDSALTMDFRQDRVTVHYDREMRVERVVCG